jgi:O-antigen ligase
MSALIINLPRWLLLGALLFAPWAYGGTRTWAVTSLDCWLGVTSALWLFSHLLRQQRPPVHPVLGVATLALLGQAWFMVLNARYEYDVRTSTFVPLEPLLAWAPGSLHRALSFENAIHVTAMLSAIWVACDLAQSPTWRKRLIVTMAGVGASIVVLGLAQKLTGATDIFWGTDDLGPNFFATYRNHTNAGAFINLAWPIAAGLALLAFLRNAALWKRVLWTLVLAIGLSGVIANSSRAAGGLALLLVCLWAGWLVWQRFRGRFEELHIAKLMIVAIALAGAVTAIAVIAGMDHTVRRWRQLDSQFTTDNTRLLAAKVCLDMVPQAGAVGFGPGTFQTTFPYFTHQYGDQLRGRWIFAHQDYLQTLVEWGYIGSALWAMVIVGAVGLSLSRAIGKGEHLTDSARVTHFAVSTALLGVLLHALVDFPLQIASIQLYVAVMLGLLWSSRHWLSEPRQRVAVRRSIKPTEEIMLAP